MGISSNERLNVANEIYKKLHSKYGEDLVTAALKVLQPKVWIVQNLT